MAGAHAGAGGEGFDAEVFLQVCADVVEQFGKASLGVAELEQRGVLRLAAGAAVIHHKLAGDLAGDLFAEVVGDERQREVDAGGDARR